MSRQRESKRAKKYPAGELAMRGYVVVERYSPIVMPAGVDVYCPPYQSFDEEPYSKIGNEPPKPSLPTGYEIDHALEWMEYCSFMWGKDKDRRDWQIFAAYAWGCAVSNIADVHCLSSVGTSNILDRIFTKIQEVADRKQGQDK